MGYKSKSTASERYVFFPPEDLYLLRHVLAWWEHKLQPFILSGIIQCCSSMSAESWTITDATTNINEAQHAWTNKFTGTKLSLVEGILRQVSTLLMLDFNLTQYQRSETRF